MNETLQIIVNFIGAASGAASAVWFAFSTLSDRLARAEKSIDAAHRRVDEHLQNHHA